MIYTICLAAMILFGSSLYFFAEFIQRWKDLKALQKKLVKIERREIDSFVLNTLFPIVERFSRLFRRIQLQRYRNFTMRTLKKAGICDALNVEELWAYQAALAAVLSFFSMATFGISLPTVVFPSVVGFAFPLLWLGGEARRRYLEINYALPDFLDRLSLSVEAGLDFMSATDRIVSNTANSSLNSELRKMLGEARLGKTRGDALRDLKEKLSHSAVDSFVSMLIQAESLGTSVVPVLKAHSAKLRSERFREAERAGIIASQKLLVPLIFCIIPAVFVVVFGPLIVMWRTGAFERLF